MIAEAFKKNYESIESMCKGLAMRSEPTQFLTMPMLITDITQEITAKKTQPKKGTK
jgi:hypothetical protein